MIPSAAAGPGRSLLLGGSRSLSNSTAAFTAGTTLTYNTAWNGTLNVDGGGFGGEFDLCRDNGGTVSVAQRRRDQYPARGDGERGRHGTDAALDDESRQRSNSVNFTGGAGRRTSRFQPHGRQLTYRGNISGNLDLTQDGSDKLVLSGGDTYSGGTYVERGTLTVAAARRCPTRAYRRCRRHVLFDPSAATGSALMFISALLAP